VEDIFLELGRRLDLLGGPNGLNAQLNVALKLTPDYALQPDRAYTLSDILDRDLKCHFGKDKGAEYFKKVGYDIKMFGPRAIYNYAYYPMGKTRYHLYFEHMKEVGDGLKANLEQHDLTVPGWDTADLMEHYRPVPHWRPMPFHKETAEYDMYIINWKTAFAEYGLGANQENPMLYEIMRTTDPYALSVLINPATAAKKGIKDGDSIVVESRTGKMLGKAKLSGRIHPEVVGVGGNYGRRSMHLNPIAREGPNYNQLLTMDDGTFDPISTAMVISARVKVSRA
jgi:anaerobic selenocysteine-containing dehydrogenase